MLALDSHSRTNDELSNFEMNGCFINFQTVVNLMHLGVVNFFDG